VAKVDARWPVLRQVTPTNFIAGPLWAIALISSDILPRQYHNLDKLYPFRQIRLSAQQPITTYPYKLQLQKPGQILLQSMKTLNILILLSLLTIRLVAQTAPFKHDWDIKYLEHDIQFTSKKKAPPPFSTSGEPQAIMFVGASVLDPSTKNDLNKIVKEEIEGIRKSLSIDEYLENDYKPEDNIVSYTEKIANFQLAVIKYRTNGEKGGQRTMPRSVRQILFIYNDKLWISSLIVLFAEDQDNMRNDQMTFIKKVLNIN